MYDIDFMDLDNLGTRAFNGSNSKLWELIYYNGMSEIKSMYQYLRTNNYISYDKIMSIIYGQNIAFKQEALYNANAVYRYIEPLVWHSNTKPEAAQGNRLELLKYWNSNRQTFLDSRYEGNEWTTDTVVLRLNNEVPVTFTLVPDTNMFLGANFNSGQATVPSIKSPNKILAGEEYKISYTPSTNLNTYIYGASHLLELGDLSLCNSTEYSLSNAINLRRIKIGDEVHPSKGVCRLSLSNTKPHINLTSIDLTKVSLETPNLNLKLGNGQNLTPALQELKLKDSNIEYLTIAGYTPLKTLSLPNGLRKIELENLLVLDNLYVGTGENAEVLKISNCPLLNQVEVLQTFVNKVLTIEADNLQCDYDHALTMDFMNWLKSVGAKLKGSIYVQTIADDNLNEYRELWPELTITMHQIYAKDVIFGVSGEGDLDE